MKSRTITNQTNNLFIIVFLLLSSLVFGQTTSVPDNNFETYLETHDANGNVVAIGNAASMGNGIANDDYVTTAKISNVTNLDVSNLSTGITDLTGISGFTALINLNCSNNSIGSLNVSGNSALEVLICEGYSVPFGGNQATISSLNLGTISSLKTLSCSINGLTSLDLSNQTNLLSLDCSYGNLTSLSLTNQTNLTSLNCSGNNLNSLNLTNQTNLLSLKCSYNNIGTLNVSNNTALEVLECAGIYIPSDIITPNATITPNVNTITFSNTNSIKTLNCANNLMTSLSLSSLNSLEILDCSINNLGSLDVSNNNALIKLDCYGYSEGFPIPTINPNISSLNLGNINLLTDLNCSENGLNELNVFYLSQLKNLNTSSNSISTLNLSNNKNLIDVYCRNNNLQILDVKNGNNNAIVNFNATNNTTLICLQVNDAIAANAGTGVYASWQKDGSVTYSDNCATYVPDIVFEAYLETHDQNGNIVSSALSMGNGISGDHYVTTTNINAVTNLNISSLTISDLTGIKDFAALEIFNCSANSLTSLDVSNNTALLVLDCFQNSLTSLNVSNNTLLQNLACFQNAITNLDFSQNTNLKTLNCEFNQLTQLNVANGNNANFTSFNASNNPNISCIQIDTGFTPTLPIWQKDATARFSLDCIETYVPDNNFETYLETHDANGSVVTVGSATSMGNGIANDDYVTTAKISNILSLYLFNENISDLTGIEDFVSLTILECSSNSLTSLNISNNTALTELICGNNSLTSLDVSNNTLLTSLKCYYNLITSLNVSNNSALLYLDCSNNSLTNLNVSNTTVLQHLDCKTNSITNIDVSNSTVLTFLNCSDNSLTGLNVSNNIALDVLDCSKNSLTNLNVSNNTSLTFLNCDTTSLTSLDVSNNTLLEILYCNTNSLTSLDVTNNSALTDFFCYNNSLTSLDVSNNIALTYLLCYDNQLNQLIVNNGNNANFFGFDATINPNLTCIQIDNGFLPTMPTWQKDATASYSTNCHFNETYIPDNNFEAYLEANGMGNGIANDDYVTTSNINSVTTLTINNKNINDVTGIEDFIALTNLDCEYNQLTTVDFTSNTALVTLRCNNNQIVNLDLFPNAALQNLYCNNNAITNLQISPGSLVNLYCENNQISLLDLSNFFNLVNVYCFNNAITQLNLLNSAGNLIDFRCNNNQLSSIDIDANINLTTFYCGNNQLTNLVLVTNTALEDLQCDNNQFTSLDVHLNTALRVLLCNNNSISNIDIAQNTALTDFYCNNNQLTNLNLSQNIALVELRCQNNQLTDLVSPSTFLQFLNCNDNALTNLDVTQNSALIDLKCFGNQLTDLDVSANAQLAAFVCSANSLTSLNLKNGNNSNMTNIAFDATGNANLTCIEVDNVAYSTTNWTNIDAQTSFSLSCHYGETYVPDNNFEQALINLGYDIVLDDYVTTSNISGLTILDVSLQNISDLTGIEYFVSLVNLNCSANNLTSLDVTNNTALTNLGCGANSLTTLDVQQNVALTELVVSQNQLTGLDVVQNVNLLFLACEGNPFTSGLDITHNTLLQDLIVNNLNLTTLDISLNDDLQTIDCNNNSITALDFTGKQDLTQVRCQNNLLTDVYLRENPLLNFVDCSNNLLTDLTIDNGNNTAITNFSFYATNNPNLTCIQVDNVAYSTTNWTNIDATAGFSTNCATFGLTNVPDNNFENYLETHEANGNVVAVGNANSMGNGIANDNYVTTAEISGVINLDVSSLIISDLTGIENFAALKYLNCQTNSLTSLDITNNTALIELYCKSNLLTSLDVSNNIALTTLNCNNNVFSILNVSNNTALRYLYCNHNYLTSLDVSNNNLLNTLDCSNNSMNNLNVSINTSLITLLCNFNPLNSLDVSNNTLLSTLDCSFNALTSLNVSNNTALKYLYCTNNSLTSLNVSNNTALIDLRCNSNSITSLNVSNITTLTNLFCHLNSITSLDVSQNIVLTRLKCEVNQLTQLNVNNGNNTNFTEFNSTTNSNLTCIQIDNGFTPTIPTWQKDLSASYSTNCTATILTNVPDNNFENYLETHDANGFFVALGSATSMGNGIANDDYVFTNRINTVINLDVNSLSITDLKGIEGFTALNNLNCSGNFFNGFDITQNTALITLNCSDTHIITLNVTQNTTLTTLNCANNSLTALDVTQNIALMDLDCSENAINMLNVTQNAALTKLYNSSNPIGTLDVTFNTGLTILSCEYNNLTTLDITQNTALEILQCYNNSLTTLDVTQNTALTYLGCENNSLNSLDVSQNNSLTGIRCSNNVLGSLDVSFNTSLTILDCQLNQLTSLNVKNGNNSNVTSFNATNNPNLTCIEVDDITIPSTPTWQKDAIASYSTNCSPVTKIWEFGQWTNGIPNLNDNAIIRDNYVTIIGNIEANSLTIDANKVVTIIGNTYIKLQSNLINNGEIIIENTGSFVQVDNAATNTGSGIFTTVIETTLLQDKDRFTYFSSPSQTEALTVFNAWANTSRIWDFDIITQDWNLLNGNEPMTATTGFAVQPATSNTFPFVGTNEFMGPFNNGVFSKNLVFNPGGIDDDNILVGNPYPSAIDASLLLNTNLGANAFYFWTHKSPLGVGGYISDDYVIWNNLGGVASVSGSPAPSGFIASGQGFFVDANASGILAFDNSMRLVGNNFDFRNANHNTNEEETKIWINLTTENNYFSQLLIGFTEHGSDAFDPTYDANRINGGAITTFYSIGQNNEHFGIEAREILNENKIITLGINLLEEITSNFTISIDHFENLEGVGVFVNDKLLNTIHDLRLSNYQFTINEIGNFDNRFELIFKRDALAIHNYILENGSLVIRNLNDREIEIATNNNTVIKQLKVYDILGKLLIDLEPNKNRFTINTNIKQGTVLLANAILKNGQILNKKFIKLY